ncbi:MAG: SusD/RagB family nutrient-binding outer membrane lipoprotein [Flavitalea sp.]
MKKYYNHIILLIVVVVISTGCKRQLTDLYNDPDQTTDPSITKLFTEILDNERVRPNYWEIRTFVAMQTGIYTQSLSYLNTPAVYQQNPSYSADRWNDFYRNASNGSGAMSQYRAMEYAYSQLATPADRAQMDVFMQAAKVAWLDQASQLVDMWGDIPFFKAGILPSSGELVYSPFDDAATIYRYILDELKKAADYFTNRQLPDGIQGTFSQQDILLHGDIQKWHRYCNSLRLRLWMRISNYDEPTARTEVLNILNNPTLFPLLQGDDGYFPDLHDILLKPLSTYTDNLYSALTELTNYSAPREMLDDKMKPSNDPRIPVLFDKFGKMVNDVFYPNADYNGLPNDLPGEAQQPIIGNYAILDSATFLLNTKLPGIVMTAAEVNFLKAEAFERWGGGDAKAYYERGIRQSITFYYYLNSLNTITRAPLIPPGATIINTFLQQPAIAYDAAPSERLEKIATQKWIHFGFLQSVQSWSEIRRTGYPELDFFPSTFPGAELPPTRLVYPSSETSYNPHYSAVKDKDVRTGKIFWQTR